MQYKEVVKHPPMFFSHFGGRSFHFLTLACTATVANRKKTLTLQNKELVHTIKTRKNIF